ncbi:aa3-type cytochrome c oxidase subunit IV [Allorhizobium sp. BGMRC 0089]|uniref:aa3-type cytochrome c oxidase subunit IV n=1 Tax=Allorhizobium sonneratiae TaxID=2934936 RepID=UPI002033311E|nr:aa3-type cytochrome c oxidase subunit IV [Allorhizobium sonneratiae]MCM2290828.1 aa3-type cytochrome c oxidase subunit IV [Allorhizobium sonneratiae]
MQEHPSGPAETGATMDYSEHEKTYDRFIAATKYGTAIIVALMLGMAAGFFTAGGFLGGILVFVILSVVGVFLMG